MESQLPIRKFNMESAGSVMGVTEGAGRLLPIDVFRQSHLHQLAVWAIESELTRRPFEWSDGAPVGDDVIALETFAHELLQSFMACGFAVWRTTPNGELQCCDPANVVITRKAGKYSCVFHRGPKRGWHIEALMPPPIHIDTPGPWHWQSPTITGYHLLQRANQIEENWLRRDGHNSRPEVFTVVSGDLKPIGGSTMHWFQNSGPAQHSLGQRPNRATFNDLIQKRTEAITKLGERSVAQRQKIMNPGGQMLHDPREAERAAHHGEHVITDGREMHETRALLSLIDGREQYARARHAVLLHLQVPPQALGESVNSERTAANRVQYDVAMGLFVRSVDRWRTIIGRIIKHATEDEGGRHVRYTTGVSLLQLNAISPFLTAEALKTLHAQAYGLPESMFRDNIQIDPQGMAAHAATTEYVSDETR